MAVDSIAYFGTRWAGIVIGGAASEITNGIFTNKHLGHYTYESNQRRQWCNLICIRCISGQLASEKL